MAHRRSLSSQPLHVRDADWGRGLDPGVQPLSKGNSTARAEDGCRRCVFVSACASHVARFSGWVVLPALHNLRSEMWGIPGRRLVSGSIVFLARFDSLSRHRKPAALRSTNNWGEAERRGDDNSLWQSRGSDETAATQGGGDWFRKLHRSRLKSDPRAEAIEEKPPAVKVDCVRLSADSGLLRWIPNLGEPRAANVAGDRASHAGPAGEHHNHQAFAVFILVALLFV